MFGVSPLDYTKLTIGQQGCASQNNKAFFKVIYLFRLFLYIPLLVRQKEKEKEETCFFLYIFTIDATSKVLRVIDRWNAAILARVRAQVDSV